MEEYAPGLATLVAEGLIEEGWHPLLICTGETFRLPAVPRLTLRRLSPVRPWSDLARPGASGPRLRRRGRAEPADAQVS